MNPRNGLCLNAIHDRAFDRGLMTITPDFKIRLSTVLLKAPEDKAMNEFFLKFENQQMLLPDRFVPEAIFLKYHNEHVFMS